MKYVLLAGQSNMAGRGNLEDAEKIYDSRIFMLKNDYLEIMVETVHTDSKSSGIGLAPSSFLSNTIPSSNINIKEDKFEF